MKLMIWFLALFAPLAMAQGSCVKIADNKAHVCWTAPTTNTDGSPIVLALTYKIEVLNPGTSVWAIAATALTATDWTSGVLQPGTYKYRIYAIAGGNESVPTVGSPDKSVPNPFPGSPGNGVIAQLTITIPATCDLGASPVQCTAMLVSAK